MHKKEHKMKIINFEMKKMISLSNKKYEWNLNQANCHICKKTFKDNYIS